MLLTVFHTHMGWVALLVNDRALVGMTLPRRTRRDALAEIELEFGSSLSLGENALARRARMLLERYFAGQRVSFLDLPFDDSRASLFQRRVWRLTRAIPYGSVRTYQELAHAAGRSNAARAVGQCMAQNPLPIIVPCHRVVGCNGQLRGFGGGLPMKRALLEMEGVL